MRIPTSETNDTLDAASRPPTEGTELDDRTRPDVDTEIRFTHDALTFAVGVSVVAAIAVRFLVPEYLGYAAIALFSAVWWSDPVTLPKPLRRCDSKPIGVFAPRASLPRVSVVEVVHIYWQRAADRQVRRGSGVIASEQLITTALT